MTTFLDRAPEFKANAVRGRGEPVQVSLAALAGRWVVLVFYPRDFTSVCPTEIRELSRRARELRGLGAEPVAISADGLDTHRRWIAEVLGEVDLPLAADPGGEIARRYGVWLDDEEVAARGTFLVDPAGVVQFAAVYPLSVGRSVSELLRVLEALQTGEPVPAEWTPGSATLER
ncbi:MAG: peroxiredoxin [Anaeromyxobacter sp.]